MAENSVFAILLRSSWWISVVVGAVIVLLCLALLPKDIRFVGAAGHDLVVKAWSSPM